MSKKKTPIEEMTREQLVQSAAQYKSLYQKVEQKVKDVTAEAERQSESLKTAEAKIHTASRLLQNSEKELEELQKKYDDLSKNADRLARYLDEANQKKARLAEEIVGLKDHTEKLEFNIKLFNERPWWRRIFAKIVID